MRITTFYWTGYLVKVTWKQDIDIRWQVKTHSGGQYIWQLCCEYHWWWISGRWGGSWCLWGGQFEEQSAIIGSAQIPFCYVVLPMKSEKWKLWVRMWGKVDPNRSIWSIWGGFPSISARGWFVLKIRSAFYHRIFDSFFCNTFSIYHGFVMVKSNFCRANTSSSMGLDKLFQVPRACLTPDNRASNP